MVGVGTVPCHCGFVVYWILHGPVTRDLVWPQGDFIGFQGLFQGFLSLVVDCALVQLSVWRGLSSWTR